MPVITALLRERQEDREFKVTRSCIANTKPDWVI